MADLRIHVQNLDLAVTPRVMQRAVELPTAGVYPWHVLRAW
jgi:hypothetical protein